MKSFFGGFGGPDHNPQLLGNQQDNQKSVTSNQSHKNLNKYRVRVCMCVCVCNVGYAKMRTNLE